MHHTFYLAPLRGVTDCVFRTAFETWFGKFDFLVTPFITTVKGEEVAPSHIKDVAGNENDRIRVIPQILGNEPADIIVLANALNTHGYNQVNLNLGCPHPQVTRKKRGSGLLPYPEMVSAILEKVIPAIDCSLSVKVRLGLDDAGELERLMPTLNGFPLAEVIIHPRTGKQQYTGKIDLDHFSEAVSQCVHPVVYNGDLFKLEDFFDRRKRFPHINRWMIGRGVAQHPDLLVSMRMEREKVSEPALLCKFHDDVFRENGRRLFGPSHLLGKMKEFWSYFCCSFADSRKVFKTIAHCSSIDEYVKRVDLLFRK